MIEALSRRIAVKIKKADPEGPVSIEVMEYELGIKLNWYTTLILTCLFGSIFSNLVGSLVAFLALVCSRKFSGGVHFRSLTICALFSSLLFATIPLIQLNTYQVQSLNALIILIFLLFSPNNYEERNESRLEPYYKLLSVLIVASNLVIQSSIICLSFAVQAISILPFWKGGERS